MNVTQLVDSVIVPVLHHIKLYSDEAVELIAGTIAQESDMGEYLRQIRGPALGICQMEPATHKDIYDNFLKYRPCLREKLEQLCSDYNGAAAEEMVGNLYYSVAMCRVHYFRVPKKLPKVGDLKGQAAYWKRWYNTPLGHGTEGQYIKSFERHIGHGGIYTSIV